MALVPPCHQRVFALLGSFRAFGQYSISMTKIVFSVVFPAELAGAGSARRRQLAAVSWNVPRGVPNLMAIFAWTEGHPAPGPVAGVFRGGSALGDGLDPLQTGLHPGLELVVVRGLATEEHPGEPGRDPVHPAGDLPRLDQ